MAITNSNDSSHIVRTSAQWKSSYDSYDTIPLGVLCVELIPDGSMKIKIGDGHNTFAKLPYVGGQAVSDYYSKRETDERIKAILKEESPMCIKGVLSGEAALPSNPVVGDVYFVLSRSSSSYIEYVYATNHSWIPIGGTPVDSDLSGYATQDYVNEQIDEVNTRIDEIVKGGTSSHTHDNKDILDSTTASFTKEDKAKLDSMSSFTSADRDKLNVLIKNSTSFEKIAALEKLAHEHSNKRILDRTTASFTTDYEQKMKWIRPYTGAENGYEGIMGLVPPAQPGEEDYVLNGAGEWVPMEIDSNIEIYNVTAGPGIEIEIEDKTVDEESNSYKVSLKPSTEFEIGGVIPGDGLSVDENGILNIKYDTTTLDINENNELTVIGGSDGKSISYIAGDAIDIHSSEELIKLTPNMTGFTTPKGEVIQRGQWEDRYGWLAFDGIDNQYYKPNAWCGGNEYKLNGLPDTCYVGYLFEKPMFISKFVISFFADHGYEGCIQVYKNKEWITVVEKIEITGSPYYSEFTFDIPITECEGYRFSMLSGYNSYMGAATYGSNVCEFEAYGYKQNTDLIIDVKYGNGLTVNEDNQLEVDLNTDSGLEIYQTPDDTTKTISLLPATSDTIGGIIVGDGLNIDENGVLTVSTQHASGAGYLPGEAIYFTDKPDKVISKSNPIMTSYNTPEGQVIYSGEYPGRPAYGPFDGVDSKTWDIHAWSDNVSVINGTPDACYDGYLFGKEVTLSKFIISFNGTTAYTAVIQVHTTNGWETVVDEFTIPINYNVLEFTIDPITCDGFRCSIISSVNGNPYFSTQYYGSNICNFEAWGSNVSKVINVKYGNGLTLDEEGNLVTEALPLEPATDEKLGGVKIGQGLEITDDGMLSVKNFSSNKYIEGDAIEFKEGPSSTSVLPEEYQQLEYIEGTGLQYLVIPYCVKMEDTIEMEVYMTQGTSKWEWAFGSIHKTDASINQCEWICRYNDTDGVIYYIRYDRATNGESSLGSFPLFTKFKVTAYKENISLEFSSDNIRNYSSQYGMSGDAISNLMLFACNVSMNADEDECFTGEGIGLAHFRLYSFRILDSDKNVLYDMIPCKEKSSGDIGIYNVIDNTFIKSETSVNFMGGPNVAVDTSINVKYGDGLTIDENGYLVTTGSNEGKEYIGGTGITIEDVQLTTELTIDIWDNGNGWSNLAYLSASSNSYTYWAAELHSSVGTIEDIKRYPILSPTRRLKYIKYDINGNPLSGHIDFHNSDCVKFYDVGWADDNDTIYTIPDDVTYISFAIRHMDHSSNINDSDIGSVKIVWLDIDNEDKLVGKISLNPATVDTIGGVKPGTGLEVLDDGTLNVTIDSGIPIINGIPGDGYLIKSLIYTGTGGVNNIVFPEKPLGIISISGLGKDNNYLYSTPTSIDNEYMVGLYGGAGTGQMLSYMSFEESTNTLTLTGKSHKNDADNFNVSGLEYTVLYAVPIPVSETYIFKTLTYTGNGEAVNNIVFPEKPEFVVSMYGYAVRNWITCESFELTNNRLMYQYGGESSSGVGTVDLSFDEESNVLSLSRGSDRGAIFNVSGEEYVVRYAVKSTVYATSDGGSGSYKLPPATTESLGGVIVGDGLIVDKNGVLSMMNKPVDTSKYVAGEAISIMESQSGEYDVLEYVISNQTQYVLTDIFPGDTTEIYLKYQMTSISTDSYIVSSGYKFTQGCLMYGILLTNREVLCSAIGTGNNIYAYNSIIPDLDIHEDTYTVTPTTFGSTLTGTNNHSYTLNKTEPIQLFGTPGLSYGSSVKLYAMKITVDGLLISELIPVRNKAASNIGLYDKLTGKIYYSKEGTKLEAGPSTGEIIKITGDNIINVKYSDGLSINENNELFVDGKEDTIPRFTKAEYEQAVLDGTAPPPGSLFIITDDEEEPDSPEYELPIASKEVLGGIKVGEGLVINNDGVLSMDNIHAYQVDMKDYQPGDDYIPIVQSDSVSTAIGKLDVGLITKENKIRRFTKAEYDQAVLDGTGPKPGELFVITDDYTTQIDPEKPFGVTDVVATPNEVGKLNVYKDGEVKTVDVFEYLELLTLNCVGDGEAP